MTTRHNWTHEYEQLDKFSKERGEDNDCAVRAICVVTGVDYAKAHALFEKHGRKAGKGTYWHTTSAVLVELDYSARRWTRAEVQALLDSYPDYVVKSVTLRQTMLFPDQWPKDRTLLLRSNGHVSAFRDGRLHDHMDHIKSRVHEIYEINPK